MSLYSLPGLDRWLTHDPADDGSQEAIDAIAEELVRDEDEVLDALVYQDEAAIAALHKAFMAGTDAGFLNSFDYPGFALHQELALCPNLSVAENLCLSSLPARRGFVDHAALRARASEMLATVGAPIEIGRAHV